MVCRKVVHLNNEYVALACCAAHLCCLLFANAISCENFYTSRLYRIKVGRLRQICKSRPADNVVRRWIVIYFNILCTDVQSMCFFEMRISVFIQKRSNHVRIGFRDSLYTAVSKFQLAANEFQRRLLLVDKEKYECLFA